MNSRIYNYSKKADGVDTLETSSMKGFLYHKDDTIVEEKMGIFKVLDGFEHVETIEKDRHTLITKFKNNDGDTRIVTQTKDEINIRWDE